MKKLIPVYLEIYLNKKSSAIYACPQCGKIEFFTPEK